MRKRLCRGCLEVAGDGDCVNNLSLGAQRQCFHDRKAIYGVCRGLDDDHDDDDSPAAALESFRDSVWRHSRSKGVAFRRLSAERLHTDHTYRNMPDVQGGLRA